jgi:hypothetical protein
LWKHCLTISLPEGWPDTYRHKEMRSTDRPTYSVRFSWSCLAETFQLCPTQLKYTNLRIATETRPIRNTPTPREVPYSTSPSISGLFLSNPLFRGFVRQLAAISDVRMYSTLIALLSSNSLT